jgi:2-oxoglutarate ferredoxin oxidoreductase subunit alpha
MSRKRIGKFAPLPARRDLFLIEGDADAELALVSWGSSAGVCREALAQARAAGLRAKILVPYLLYPVAEEIIAGFFAGVARGLVVEQSYQGQLYRVLRMFVDLPKGVKPFCRAGANPFRPSEVLAELRRLATPAAHAGAAP